MKTSSLQKFSILGCGWLGLPLAKELISLGFCVNGSTTSAEKFSSLSKEGINPIQLIIDENGIQGDIDAFLNSNYLLISVPFRQQRQCLKSYEKLAKMIAASTVKNVVFISSTSVYADNNSFVYEDSYFIPNPEKSNLLSLESLFSNHTGFETTILRFSGLIGGSRNPGNFFKETRVVSNGCAPVNLIHIEDCIGIVVEIIRQGCWGEILNATADTHPSRKEFYTAATKKQGKTPATFIENPDYTYKIVANDKLKKKLNYTFIHPDLMTLVKS